MFVFIYRSDNAKSKCITEKESPNIKYKVHEHLLCQMDMLKYIDIACYSIRVFNFNKYIKFTSSAVRCAIVHVEQIKNLS